MKKSHILFTSAGKHQVQICDQLTNCICMLVHGIISYPDISLFYGFKISHQTFFCKKIVYAFYRSINTGVVLDNLHLPQYYRIPPW